MSDTLSISLKESWKNDSVKINSFSPGSRPWTARAALWPTDSGFYQFGGAKPPGSTNDDLWEFRADGNGGGTWSQSPDPEPLVHGWQGATCSSGRNIGYCLGGLHFKLGHDDNLVTSSNLVMYNFSSDNPTWSKEPFSNSHSKRLMGVSETIPDLGDEGVFLALGGLQVADSSSTDINYSVRGNAINMNTIQLFDPASKKWMSQKTTGSIPPPRVDACSVLTKSPSGSYEL
jgi:hypothetical protein